MRELITSLHRCSGNVRWFRSLNSRNGRDDHFHPPQRKWAATASVAWIPGNARDVARRRADAWGRLHSNLRGPTRLRGKRQATVDARSRTILEGCDGAGHGANDGALGFFA